jgi:L-ascorbate metabolism protein UlaG (beta-lactamase superfamily)
VLLTHVHIDHTDPYTVLLLSEASPEARFVAPFTSSDTLVEAGLGWDRIVVPDTGEPVDVSGARVTAVPGHFVSHLYGLNPMRPHKLLRPGELLYFVKDIAP